MVIMSLGNSYEINCEKLDYMIMVYSYNFMKSSHVSQ